MIPGLARSGGVIERMIASVRSSSRSSMLAFFSCFIAPMPGIIPRMPDERAHFADLAHLGEEVLERELVLFEFFLELFGGLLVDLRFGFLDQGEDVAHAEDPLRHPVRMEAGRSPRFSRRSRRT